MNLQSLGHEYVNMWKFHFSPKEEDSKDQEVEQTSTTSGSTLEEEKEGNCSSSGDYGMYPLKTPLKKS